MKENTVSSLIKILHQLMKPKTVIACCPGHISGYFKRVIGETIADTGSIGAGIVISKGVTATVNIAGETSICVKRKNFLGSSYEVASGSPLLDHALNHFGVKASVITESVLPLGAGFGLSAAALLATLTAVNHLFNLGMTGEDIGQCAHAFEVSHHTGLGDVAACQDGGWDIRSGPGIHGLIERKFDMPEPLYIVSFGPIRTPAILGSPRQMKRIESAFPQTIPESIDDLFLLSRHFAEHSGLMTREVEEVLHLCDAAGVLSSMTMLGNGVFAYGRNAYHALLPFGPVYECHMSSHGARIIEVLS